MLVELPVVVLGAGSDEVVEVVPLALLLDVEAVVVDELDGVLVKEGELLLPLLLQDAPDVLFFASGVGHHLYLVVELLNGGEIATELFALAHLAAAVLVQLNAHALAPARGFHLGNKIQ